MSAKPSTTQVEPLERIAAALEQIAVELKRHHRSIDGVSDAISSAASSIVCPLRDIAERDE